MRAVQAVLLLLLTLGLSGCEVIAGIFEAGFWVGAIVVLLVVVLLGFVFTRLRR